VILTPKPPLPRLAAVCVYPQFVPSAKILLAGSGVKVATVVNFPHGTQTVADATHAIREAITQGAHEIDVVFPYVRYLAGDKLGAQEFVRQCKIACGSHLLKVILETGAYPDYQWLEEAAGDAVLAGADFLKTSTGKITQGVTPETAAVLLTVIKNMQHNVKRPLGFKASGGVRTLAQAATYVALANHILGSSWVTPATFRLGASQLIDVLAPTL
jgi:deoxyribose-phosphate aldolase